MENIFRQDEALIYALRQLYQSYGYTYYRAGRFEEYELYARNRSFLKGDGVLTFTNPDGRLMAARPDVTLSIVRDYRGKDLQKLCYNESVYRPGAGGFQAIAQTGLECLGPVDLLQQCEVLMLACRSLKQTGFPYRLDLSHMNWLDGLLGEDISEADKMDVIRAVSRKNESELDQLLQALPLPEERKEALSRAATSYGRADDMLKLMEGQICNEKTQKACDELRKLTEGLKLFEPDAEAWIDLSMTDDSHYYSGLVFHGMLRGIPEPVLLGGEYDHLMRRMGKQGRAIGFAVYLNLLERYGTAKEDMADVFLRIQDSDRTEDVIAAIEAIRKEGLSVFAGRKEDRIAARRTASLKEGKWIWND